MPCAINTQIINELLHELVEEFVAHHGTHNGVLRIARIDRKDIPRILQAIKRGAADKLGRTRGGELRLPRAAKRG